jgi:hypothetical protein
LVVKGCSNIFAAVLKQTVNLNLSQQYRPTVWKQAGIVPVKKKKARMPLLDITDTYAVLINFPNYFNLLLVTMFHNTHSLNLNSCRHGFAKSESTITNLVFFLRSITPLVGFLNEGDATHFDISSACYLEPHTLLLHKRCAFAVCGGYVNWCRSPLTNR